MKVKVEREVDLDILLSQLNEKSQCKHPGMFSYEITVNKQLLRDAHDVIKQITNDEKYISVPNYKYCIKK